MGCRRANGTARKLSTVAVIWWAWHCTDTSVGVNTCSVADESLTSSVGQQRCQFQTTALVLKSFSGLTRCQRSDQDQLKWQRNSSEYIARYTSFISKIRWLRPLRLPFLNWTSKSVDRYFMNRTNSHTVLRLVVFLVVRYLVRGRFSRF